MPRAFPKELGHKITLLLLHPPALLLCPLLVLLCLPLLPVLLLWRPNASGAATPGAVFALRKYLNLY